MKYAVVTVEDHEMPAGVTGVIVESFDGAATLVVSGERARCWRFMEAYADSVKPEHAQTLLRAV